MTWSCKILKSKPVKFNGIERGNERTLVFANELVRLIERIQEELEEFHRIGSLNLDSGTNIPDIGYQGSQNQEQN